MSDNDNINNAECEEEFNYQYGAAIFEQNQRDIK